MSDYGNVNVVCPCGRLLKSVKSNFKNQSTTNSSMKCTSCKKDVAIQVRGANAYTSYK